MSRRTLLLGLLAIVVFAGTALLVLPARWIMLAFPSHWPLTVVDATGTIWKGSATLSVGPAHLRHRLPDTLVWSWSISRGLNLTVTHPWLDGPLTATATYEGILISSRRLTMPAQTLAAVDARLKSISPSGSLMISWPTLKVGLNGLEPGTQIVKAEWRDAASALSPIRPLGHYTVSVVQQADRAAQLTLQSTPGPLLMEGTGKLNGTRGFLFEGYARAAPQASPDVKAALQDLLTALGPRQNDSTLLHIR